MSPQMLTQTGAFKARWSVLMVLVSALMVAAACVLYTQHVQHQAEQRWRHAQRESDQRWCELLATLDNPTAPPPETPRGAEIQQEVRQLRVDLGCERREPR